MKVLTEKQKNVLNFIEQFLDREGMAPTIYEIADHFDIKTSTAFAHLRALQRKNQLARSSKARSLNLLSRPRRRRVPRRVLMIPLLGGVHAGVVAESIQNQEGEICIASSTAVGIPAENLFALRVRGESMRDLGIYDGDIVIVGKDNLPPRDGDIVVAELAGGEVTVKSWYNGKRGTVELRPANPDFPVQTFKASEVTVQGKVLELRRSFN